MRFIEGGKVLTFPPTQSKVNVARPRLGQSFLSDERRTIAANEVLLLYLHLKKVDPIPGTEGDVQYADRHWKDKHI